MSTTCSCARLSFSHHEPSSVMTHSQIISSKSLPDPTQKDPEGRGNTRPDTEGPILIPAANALKGSAAQSPESHQPRHFRSAPIVTQDSQYDSRLVLRLPHVALCSGERRNGRPHTGAASGGARPKPRSLELQAVGRHS